LKIKETSNTLLTQLDSVSEMTTTLCSVSDKALAEKLVKQLIEKCINYSLLEDWKDYYA